MKQYFVFLLLLCLDTLPFKSHAISGSQVNDLGLINTSGIDVQHIALDLSFNWKLKQAQGKAVLTITMLQPTATIRLDAAKLTINAITMGNGTPLPYIYDTAKADVLEVKPGQPYKKNETVTIVILYHTNYVNETDPNNIWGSSGQGLRFQQPGSAEPAKRKQVWSVGEAEGNRYWFPCHDVPGDLYTFELTATVEQPLTAISNGVLKNTKDNGDGTRSFYWKADKPCAGYQNFIAVGNYADVVQQHNNILLHSYGYPDEADAVKATTVRLPDMMQYFSTLTGIKYPYDSYCQVFVQELPAWLGYSGASVITENMIDDYRTHADYFYLWDITEAEALAHQWFGSFVAIKEWKDAWLDKGFSHYIAEMYNEKTNGKDEFLLYQRLYDHNAVYLNDWKSGYRVPVVDSNYESAVGAVSGNYPFFRGALVLHMLRKQLGEAQWQKTIRLYLQTNANRVVTTTDFIHAAESVAGESLQWFFDQWVYKTGHPEFVVTKSYDAAKKQMALKVVQAQLPDTAAINPVTTYFKGRVDVEIDDHIEKVWLEPKAENTYFFSAEQAPVLVNFDHESTWIKEMVFEKPLSELICQLQNDRDILGKQWAMSQLVKRSTQETTTETELQQIQVALRNVVTGNDYWRIRYNSLVQLQNMVAPMWDDTIVLKDQQIISMLTGLASTEKAWIKTAAINFLGMTRDARYTNIYLQALSDSSDRVINAAAIALGKSKSAAAFDALKQLKEKPSWKNQSLISALYGLKELNDPRSYDIAYNALSDLHAPRWTLATPVWDFRITAAMVIASLGKTGEAYELVAKRIHMALEENDVNSVFQNVLLIAVLGDSRGAEVFETLRKRYINDANALAALDQYEDQFKQSIKK